jgi:hypothetical protein
MRSAIPKVMGILMIIFSSLALLFGLIGLAKSSIPPELKEIDAFKTFTTISLVFGVVGLGISVLHLLAGIKAVGYKAGAPKLATMYAIVSMAFTVVNVIVVMAWLKPAMVAAMEKEQHGIVMFDIGALVGVMVIIGTVINLAYATLVLVLMTRPAAKAACVN